MAPPVYGPSSNAASAIFQIAVEMARLASSGTLVVYNLPDGVTVWIDGSLPGSRETLGPGTYLLMEGEHRLRLQGFGYPTLETTVTIVHGQTLSFPVSMVPQAFTFSRIRPSVSVLEARAPGVLGSIVFTIEADAPGQAILEVLDPFGAEVYASSVISIRGPRTTVAWNGRDEEGSFLKAGTYTVVVRDASGLGEGYSRVEASFQVSSSRIGATYSLDAGGFSGALFAPDARVLGPNRLSLAGGYTAATDNNYASYRSLTTAGLRMGLGKGSELSASWLKTTYQGYGFGSSADATNVSAWVKSQLYRGEEGALALMVGGNYGFYDGTETPPSWDGMTRFPGLGAGLIMESATPYLRLFASAQAQVSEYYPGWDLASAVPGLYSWLYLRGGVDILLQDFLGGQGNLALSAAGRTEPFQTGLGFTLPLSIGAELHWYPHGSAMVLSAFGTGEWESRNSWYFGGGFGVGFQY